MSDGEDAMVLAARSDLWWYHRFALGRDVWTSGVSDVELMLDDSSVPARLDGSTVLDVGTIDGGVAFAAERRGARRVVATEFRKRDDLAFSPVARALSSSVEYLECSVYDIPRLIDEQFDIVFFRGCLYHLRHPLLGIEAVREVCRGRLIVETAVSGRSSGAEFYPGRYRGDDSCWFVPSRRCAIEWFESSGFEVTRLVSSSARPGRILFEARPTAAADR